MLALSKRNIFLPFISDIIEPLIRCMFFHNVSLQNTSLGNQPVSPVTGIDTGQKLTSSDPEVRRKALEELSNIEAAKGQNSYKPPFRIDQFPPDLDLKTRPYVIFASALTKGGLGQGYVALPMPTNMAFQDQATFGTVNASAAEMGLTEGEGALGSGFAALGGAVKDLVGKIAGGSDTVRALARSQGLAKNPNIITEFSGMATRRYTFQYKFMPRTAKESQTIRDIQYLFQARAYPTVKVENLVLQYPPKWRIKFLNTDLPGLYECYLESVGFTVNPSANTWHRDGAPGEVDLQLSFMETKALTAEEIIKLQN